MSTTLTLNPTGARVTRVLKVPRGAQFVGWLFTQVVDAAAAVQRQRGRRRDERRERALMDGAVQLRAYAMTLRDSAPALAADLLAAANRHEAAHEEAMSSAA